MSILKPECSDETNALLAPQNQTVFFAPAHDIQLGNTL